jgi:hypothetical protein
MLTGDKEPIYKGTPAPPQPSLANYVCYAARDEWRLHDNNHVEKGPSPYLVVARPRYVPTHPFGYASNPLSVQHSLFEVCQTISLLVAGRGLRAPRPSVVRRACVRLWPKTRVSGHSKTADARNDPMLPPMRLPTRVERTGTADHTCWLWRAMAGQATGEPDKCARV